MAARHLVRTTVVPMVALTVVPAMADSTGTRVVPTRDWLTAGQRPVHTTVAPTAARRAPRTAVLPPG